MLLKRFGFEAAAAIFAVLLFPVSKGVVSRVWHGRTLMRSLFLFSFVLLISNMRYIPSHPRPPSAFRIAVLGLTLGGLLLILSGCKPAAQSDAAASGPVSPVAAPLDVAPVAPSGRFAVVIDLSLSGLENRTPIPTLADLEPLLDIIQQRGGELAVSFVCSDSTQPLLRVKVDEAPQPDREIFQAGAPPEAPDLEMLSPFDRPAAIAEHQDRVTAYQQDIQGYQDALEQHRSGAKRAMAEFVSSLQDVLPSEPNCQESDINGALRPAQLFLDEPHQFSQAPLSYLLVVSDGLDTVDKEAVHFNDNVHVVLVNGTGTKGVFGGRHHLPFEAVSAAVDYVVDSVNKGASAS